MQVTTHAQRTLLQTALDFVCTDDKTTNFILNNGWAPATTRQYAAAVNKYTTFLKSLEHDGGILPASSKNLYHFILWCATTSRTPVASSTIKRYLTGLRMWHTLHDQPFPSVNGHRVRLLLKSVSKIEVHRPKRHRVGLTLQDMVDLTDYLTSDNSKDLVTKAVLLVGFWGLARLGELTLHPDHPSVFLRRKDVRFSKDGRTAYLRLRLAKSAGPGESQFLCLRSQPNRLDPVNVLHELLLKLPGSGRDPLFPGSNKNVPICKEHVLRFLRHNGPQDDTKWGGHSLRIGGASFQVDAGRTISSLQRLGRWRSNAYKRYVFKYSPTLSLSTKRLASLLHF